MNPSEPMKAVPRSLDYPFLNQGVDEAFSPDGEIRAHWRYLLESMQTLGLDGIEERQIKAQRILRDDGATYKVYSDPAHNQS